MFVWHDMACHQVDMIRWWLSYTHQLNRTLSLCKQEKWLIFHGCATCGRVAVQCFLLEWFINNPFHWSTWKLVYTIHSFECIWFNPLCTFGNEREIYRTNHCLNCSRLCVPSEKILRCKMFGKLRVFLAIRFCSILFSCLT